MSNTYQITWKTLNVLFFAFIILCSYSTVLNKVHKKTRKHKIHLETEESQILNISAINPLLTNEKAKDAIKNLGSTIAKSNENQKQKKFENQILQLDSQNESLNVAAQNLSTEALNCYKKFQLVINNYPLEVQTQIVSEFQNYFAKKTTAKGYVFDANLCCNSQNLIKATAQKFNAITKAFTGLVAQQEKDCKNGFACFRGNEVLVKALGIDVDSGYKNKNQEALKKLLTEGKKQNSNLIKCLVHLQKVSVRNLGMICANDNLLSLTFVSNAENKLVRPKKFPDDDFDLFTNCGDYVKNFNLYSEEITNAFVDSINFLLGSEQCNYFSNFFSGKAGRKPLNPKMFMKTTIKKNFLESSKSFVTGLFSSKDKNKDSRVNNSTLSSNLEGTLQQLRGQLQKGDSTAVLIKRWAECASTVKDFSQETVENLRNILPKKISENPNGLQNGILDGVDFNAIKRNFDASSNPKFLLSCDKTAGCKLGLGASSNVNNVKDSFNATSVILRPNVTLEYSCCDRVCVVNYKNNFIYENDTVNNFGLDLSAEVQNGFDSILPTEFMQDQQFLDKVLNVVGLGKKNKTDSTKKTDISQRINNLRNQIIVSGAEIFEIKPFNINAQKATEQDIQKLNSALKTLKSSTGNGTFPTRNLLKQVTNYAENIKNYVNDRRIKAALKLNIKLENGTLTTLSEFIQNDLIGRQNLLNLACAEGKCQLSQIGQEGKTYELAPNTNLSLAKNRKLASSGIVEVKEPVNGTVAKKGFLSGFKDTVSNLFSSKNKTVKQGNDKKGNKGAKSGSTNKVNNIQAALALRELYYRPNYNDLQANFTVDALSLQSLKKLITADVSRFAIGFSPNFNRTSFLDQLNKDFTKSFTLDFECSEYFCVILAKSNSDLFRRGLDDDVNVVFLEVRQRKPFSFNTQKLSVTQKKCIVKNILLNGKQEPEFFEVDLKNINLNSTVDSAVSFTNRTRINIIEKCDLNTSPYIALPISNDCLSSLVGHCQKSNFFDLYNRYTRGIASYDDLPASKAWDNTCISPVECAKIDNNSAKEEKAKCGAAMSNLLFINGSRLSLTKLITPCNGELPAASVEPIAFVALNKNKL